MTPGTFWTESEFDGGLNATCGPNALAMAECWALQKYLGEPRPGQTATMVIYQRMRAAGRCDANGAATGGGLLAQARADGFQTKRLGFKNPLGRAEWLGFLKARFAERPTPAVVVMELAHGAALRNALTGHGEDAGPDLAFHYICCCDYHPGGPSRRAGRTLPEGIWCADGDSDDNNPIVGGQRTRVRAGHALQFYPLETLDAARPCDLVAVYARVKLDDGQSGGGNDMAIPTGWKDDGATLTAPNGVPVVRGFRAHVLAHGWDAEDAPLAPERGVDHLEPGDPRTGAGVRQDFRFTALGWTPDGGVYRIPLGQDVVALTAALADRDRQIADLKAKLDAAGSGIPEDARKALAAVQALAAALGRAA